MCVCVRRGGEGGLTSSSVSTKSVSIVSDIKSTKNSMDYICKSFKNNRIFPSSQCVYVPKVITLMKLANQEEPKEIAVR